MARGIEVGEALAIAVEKIVLALVAADDELEVRARAQMAPDLEQHDVIELVVPGAARGPEVGELVRVLLVGEKAAAARGLGVVGEAVLRGERHLRLARAAVEVLELLAVHPAFALGQGLGQELGAQRAQQAIEGAGFARHHRHGVLALRHRPLADDLAGDDEVEAVRLHPFARLAHHEALAVETRVQVRAVAVLRVDDDVLVLVDDVDDVQLDAELLGHPQCVVALGFELVLAADGVRVALDAEAGIEVDALDVDALLLEHARGEHGVETAGDERNGFSGRRGGGRGNRERCGCRHGVAVNVRGRQW
jgi:hypothetical protein